MSNNALNGSCAGTTDLHSKTQGADQSFDDTCLRKPDTWIPDTGLATYRYTDTQPDTHIQVSVADFEDEITDTDTDTDTVEK